jgi:hypothetical protein
MQLVETKLTTNNIQYTNFIIIVYYHFVTILAVTQAIYQTI